LEEFKKHKNELDKELERFMCLLNQILPHYHSLLKKELLESNELERLGEIEHYLLGVNSKIMEIKSQLEQDLFGQSLDTYYKLKVEAINGNPNSKLKLEKMREIFAEALKLGEMVNYN
jgi:hypothetical protein